MAWGLPLLDLRKRELFQAETDLATKLFTETTTLGFKGSAHR
jgi:hypothetical protein